MLQLKNVDLSVSGHKLLSSINVSFEKGRIYGVLGPNGSGKTTLFKTILGLADFEGKILSSGNEKYGMLIEYPGFYDNLTVLENLILHAKYLQIDYSIDSIKSILLKMGLWSAKNKKFSTLSLGMKQKLGIARAFFGDPTIILLDEPTNGLDPIAIKEVRELIRNTLISNSNCIIISSHNLNEIAAITDKLLFLRNGQIVKQIDNEGFSEKDLEEMYENIIQGGTDENSTIQ